MSRRLIGKLPKFEFGVCLFESNRSKINNIYNEYKFK